MIVVAIAALAGVVLAMLAALFVSLPSFPTSVTSLMDWALVYVRQAAGIFWAFVEPAPCKMMLSFSIALMLVFESYKIVMWVVKKIPMFGVSE